MGKKLSRYLNWIGINTKGLIFLLTYYPFTKRVNGLTYSSFSFFSLLLMRLQFLTLASIGDRPLKPIKATTSSGRTMLKPWP